MTADVGPVRWSRGATLAIFTLVVLAGAGVLAFTVVDGWRPAGGNGVGWIELLLRDDPQARVDDYLSAIAARDRARALSLWEIPDRGYAEALAALGDRRPAVTDTLLALRPSTHRIVDLQWWSTCCEPHPVKGKAAANAARITVALAGSDERYTFDLRASAPGRSPLDEVARRWAITDVYRVGDEPLLLRWIAQGTGSITLGTPYPPRVVDCGHSEEGPSMPYDARGRDCVWSAFSSGTPVRWSLTMRTTEGDPIRATLVAQRSFIVLTRDVTADNFSAPADRRLWAWQCRSMTKRPWATDPSRYSFELTECEGDGRSATLP